MSVMFTLLRYLQIVWDDAVIKLDCVRERHLFICGRKGNKYFGCNDINLDIYNYVFYAFQSKINMYYIRLRIALRIAWPLYLLPKIVYMI